MDKRQLTREVIRHTEALIKQTYSQPPISSDSHVAAYPEMLRDATVTGCIEGMRSEILARDWYLEPATGGGGDVADLTLQLESAELRVALENALEGLTRGFMPHEISWKWRKGKGFTFQSFADINPDQIGFNVDDQMRVLSIVSRPYGGDLQTLQADKLWIHRHRPSRRHVAGRSILESAWRAWYAKDQTLRLWGLQTQRYGMGHYILRVPQTYTDAQRTDLTNAFYNLLMDGVAVIPDDVAYEMMAPAFSQGVNFENAVLLHNSQIRLALLFSGQDASPGARNYQTGATMQETSKTTRYALTLHAREMCDSFRAQVLGPLCAANYGPDAPCPKLHLRGMTDTDPDQESLRQGQGQTSQTTTG